MAIKLSRNILIKYWYCFSTLNLSCKQKRSSQHTKLAFICLHNKATKNQLFSLHLFQIGYQHYRLHDWKYIFNVFWKIKALLTISKLNLKNWFREGYILTKTRRQPLREDKFFRLPDRDRPSAMLSMRARNKTDPDPGLGSPI